MRKVVNVIKPQSQNDHRAPNQPILPAFLAGAN